MASRILLITPEFYCLENKIKSALEESGFEVVWFENKILTFDYHGTRSKLKLLRRIYFVLFAPHIRYIKEQLGKIGNQSFDILFAINGFVACPYLFKKLKLKNPGLFSILFLWDSFSMYNWNRELRYFDRVLTFDPEDSKKYHLEYKPNFYVINNQPIGKNEKYDLFFVGKFNPSRFSVVEKIISQAENAGIKYFVKLWPAYKIFFHNRLMYILFKKINLGSNWIKNYLLNYEAIEGKIIREYLMSKSLNYEEVQHYLMCSNVILDIPFQGQTGYSHRLIEALVYGKKVITTNSNIKKESFYNSEQIYIIYKQNPELDCNWINEKSTFPVDRFFVDLQLSTWLKSIINAEIA